MADSVTNTQSKLKPDSLQLKRTVIAACVFALVAAVIYSGYSINVLQRRSRQIVVGMTRDDVEALLGPPQLTLSRSPAGTGEILAWTDMFWQVDVAVDAQDRVQMSRCVTANSAIRRTQKKFNKLLN